MEESNRDLDRAKRLLKELEPELLQMLARAPEYGSCGIDAVFHRGEISRTIERCEATVQRPRAC